MDAGVDHPESRAGVLHALPDWCHNNRDDLVWARQSLQKIDDEFLWTVEHKLARAVDAARYFLRHARAHRLVAVRLNNRFVIPAVAGGGNVGQVAHYLSLVIRHLSLVKARSPVAFDK